MAGTDEDPDAVVADDDDFGGGDTKAHYTPVTPRSPAVPLVLGCCTKCGSQYHFTHQHDECVEAIRTAVAGEPVAFRAVALMEQTSVAEMFQEMLRRAFSGGVLYAVAHPHGDDPGGFESAFQEWYAREVLK